MLRGESWSFETGENELALVVLGGVCEIDSNRGHWSKVGRRANVFEGMPYTLYLPRHTRFTVTSISEQLDIADGWCAAGKDHAPRLMPPAEVAIEIRGGGNATRQINKMIPPGNNHRARDRCKREQGVHRAVDEITSSLFVSYEVFFH